MQSSIFRRKPFVVVALSFRAAPELPVSRETLISSIEFSRSQPLVMKLRDAYQTRRAQPTSRNLILNFTHSSCAASGQGQVLQQEIEGDETMQRHCLGLIGHALPAPPSVSMTR